MTERKNTTPLHLVASDQNPHSSTTNVLDFAAARAKKSATPSDAGAPLRDVELTDPRFFGATLVHDGFKLKKCPYVDMLAALKAGDTAAAWATLEETVAGDRAMYPELAYQLPAPGKSILPALLQLPFVDVTDPDALEERAYCLVAHLLERYVLAPTRALTARPTWDEAAERRYRQLGRDLFFAWRLGMESALVALGVAPRHVLIEPVIDFDAPDDTPLVVRLKVWPAGALDYNQILEHELFPERAPARRPR